MAAAVNYRDTVEVLLNYFHEEFEVQADTSLVGDGGGGEGGSRRLKLAEFALGLRGLLDFVSWEVSGSHEGVCDIFGLLYLQVFSIEYYTSKFPHQSS